VRARLREALLQPTLPRFDLMSQLWRYTAA